MTIANNSDWQKYAKSIGVDPKGNNPLGPGLRGQAVGVTPMLWNRGFFASENEPGRQASLTSAINQFTPGGIQSTINAQRSNLMGQANETGQLLGNYARAQGSGIGVEQGLKLQSLQNAAKQANDYASFMMSPEGQKQIQAYLQYLYSQAQNLGLDQVAPLFNMIETRNSANSRDRAGAGLGGLMQSIGGLAGNFIPMPGMGGSVNSNAVSRALNGIGMGVGAGFGLPTYGINNNA